MKSATARVFGAVLTLTAAMAVFSPRSATAAVPPLMSYQGKLTDAAGKLVTDGSYEMRFSLHAADSGGTALWTEFWESPSAVPVTNGKFSVLLGSRTPVDLPFDEGYWLGIEVKSGSSWESLSPRQRIASAAYAFMAGKAETADVARSVAAADISGAISGAQLADGAVTAEKISPEAVTFIHRMPGVTGISPDCATEGYAPFTATITGGDFQSSSRARIGSADLTAEDVSGSSSMTALVPAGLPAGVHDVSVSNIYFDWGTGAGLFTVNTPTPTPTPTATPTSTPTSTATPTPWNESRCESTYGGYWGADGLGGEGCWFQAATWDTSSCTDVCADAGLDCDPRDWNTSGDCTIPGISPWPWHSLNYCNSSSYSSAPKIDYSPDHWYKTRAAGVHQDCDAAGVIEGGKSTVMRMCVCKP